MRTTGPGQSPLLLLDVVDVLRRQGVSYAVIGAMAAAYHGVVRASLDADAILFPGDRSLELLTDELRKEGFRASLRRGDPEDPIPSLIAVEDSHENRVDLLGGLRGLDPAALTRAVAAPFEGASILMIGLEDFVAMKLFAGSPRDLEDARGTLSVAGPKADLGLLRRLSLRFGKRERELLESLLEDRGGPG